jgi:mono/diheme cytochrome c family protein
VAILVVQAQASQTKAATASIVKVTVGKPSEVSVRFSKASMIPPGSVVFKVTNLGTLKHTFKVCSSPTGGTANACSGKAVVLAAGPTGNAASLTLKLQKGKYEFLSLVSGQQSVAGTKGLLGVGVSVPTKTSPIPLAGGTKTTPTKTTTTPTPTTTTTPAGGANPTAPAPGFPVGTASSGAPLFTSLPCGSCHTLAAAGTTGTLGPNLDTVKPSVAVAEIQIQNGGLDMPPFGSQISMQQIADLATYVYQSTH